MIVLYHCISARSLRPLWALEEMGVPYTLKMLPFPPRAHDKSYFAENPLGTIPLMIDGETRMTESAAISQYLAARFSPRGLNVEMDEADYGAYLNFLHFGEATLTFPQTLVLRYSRFEPDERKQPQVVEDYAKWFLARLKTLEARLEARTFLCADRFTAADISVGYALLLAQLLGLDAQFLPHVAAYWRRLQQLPSYKRAMAAQDTAAHAQGVSTKRATDA